MLFLVCEPFARLSTSFFSFANPSRDSQRAFWLLRTLREVVNAVRHACEGFASLTGGGRESLWFLRPFGSKRPFVVERDFGFISHSRFEYRLTQVSPWLLEDSLLSRSSVAESSEAALRPRSRGKRRRAASVRRGFRGRPPCLASRLTRRGLQVSLRRCRHRACLYYSAGHSLTLPKSYILPAKKVTPSVFIFL